MVHLSKGVWKKKNPSCCSTWYLTANRWARWTGLSGPHQGSYPIRVAESECTVSRLKCGPALQFGASQKEPRLIFEDFLELLGNPGLIVGKIVTVLEEIMLSTQTGVYSRDVIVIGGC